MTDEKIDPRNNVTVSPYVTQSVLDRAAKASKWLDETKDEVVYREELAFNLVCVMQVYIATLKAEIDDLKAERFL